MEEHATGGYVRRVHPPLMRVMFIIMGFSTVTIMLIMRATELDLHFIYPFSCNGKDSIKERNLLAK